jgi:hypothetical protein
MPVTMSRCTLRLMLLVGLVAASFSAAPVLAQGSKPIQTQDTNAPGVVAELVECKREDGVLTVRVLYRNTTDKRVSMKVVPGQNYDEYYMTAGSKKYLMMRDPQKMTLSPQAKGGGLTIRLDKGGTYQWWAKYPAPPAEVKKINYYTPLTAPFDNVPISD